MRILNLGSGRDCVDNPNNYNKIDEVTFVDQMYKNIDVDLSANTRGTNWSIKEESIQEFLEKGMEKKYDIVDCTRCFEHLKPNDVFYILYLIHKNMLPDGVLTIVVPDMLNVFKTLGELEQNLCKGVVRATEFQCVYTAIHTEIFNESFDPHQSIWTPQLAKHYIEAETYFKIQSLSYITLDNRDWYMKIKCIHNER